jgi:hypothetical protein
MEICPAGFRRRALCLIIRRKGALMLPLIVRFLHWTAVPMTPPGMFSPFHLGITAALVLAAFFLARYFSGRPERTRIRVLAATGWLLAALELYKQLFYYFLVNGGRYDWWYFPFQLCSVPMYLCILLPFVRGRVRRSFCTFMATYNLLGAVFALAYPADMLRAWWAMTLHAFFWHGTLIFIALLVIFSGMYGKKLRDFAGATILFAALAGIAEIINAAGWHLGTIPGTYPDMFYITPYVATTQPVVRNIAAAFGIPAANAVYLLCVALLSLLLFAVIRRTPAGHRDNPDRNG